MVKVELPAPFFHPPLVCEKHTRFFNPTFMSSMKAKYPALELTIELLAMPEPVTRSVWVRTGTSLRELHHIIQAVMPWDTGHLYFFSKTVKGSNIQLGDTKLWDGDMPESNDDLLHYVEDYFVMIGQKMNYVYDIGDHWAHEIVLTGINTDPFTMPYLPMVSKGSGVCPPEDCGGPAGYLDILEALKNKRTAKYKSTKAWLKDIEWSDAPFDLDDCQQALAFMKIDMLDQYIP